MLSVDEALQMVLSRAVPRAPEVRPADEALGLVLAEDVTSDVDSPPHDKSLVDGYAIVAAELADGAADFELLEEVTAGAVPSRAVTRGHTTRIMTGAPIPEGADAVVMVERAELSPTANGLPRVRLQETAKPGQNIMRRAVSMRRGDVVLRAGAALRAVELGVLAEVGRLEVRVIDRPRLAVLSTGNELVPPTQLPGPGQIRNSNGPMVTAAAQAAGAAAVNLGIARDEPAALRAAIARGLEHDVLAISGGVSAGVLDLVPGVLAELGVEQVFHKVNLKPGKPLWFGVRAQQGGGNTLVFGLPGNPVSSLVCFELFVRPAIARLAGRGAASLGETSATLTADFLNRSDRATYFPARLAVAEQGTTVEPLRWQGSGDLRTLVEANALACFPPGPLQFRAGDCIRVLRLASAGWHGHVARE
ncbi:MAG: gephyrin-like molybdotransferase Glp [Pirellulales bacterium]